MIVISTISNYYSMIHSKFRTVKDLTGSISWLPSWRHQVNSAISNTDALLGVGACTSASAAFESESLKITYYDDQLASSMHWQLLVSF